MSDSSYVCEKCGSKVGIGDWPFCPHGSVRAEDPFKAYWDEHVAPPPDVLRKETGYSGPLPYYDRNRGAYEITSLGERHKLMKLNKVDYARTPTGRSDRRRMV